MKSLKTPIGEIVSNDFRTAELFNKAGMDFCCGGNITLEEACKQEGLDPNEFMEKINAIMEQPERPGQNFSQWSLDFLCDYIINTHHKFVREALPDLEVYTEKIASVHGENHRELTEVADLFAQIAKELKQHMEKEEEVLFPAIKSALYNQPEKYRAIISDEITRMAGEHEFAGGAMDKINRITNRYELPEDACNTYSVCFKMLALFEDDLHIHVHLENNILFKKALEL